MSTITKSEALEVLGEIAVHRARAESQLERTAKLLEENREHSSNQHARILEFSREAEKFRKRIDELEKELAASKNFSSIAENMTKAEQKKTADLTADLERLSLELAGKIRERDEALEALHRAQQAAFLPLVWGFDPLNVSNLQIERAVVELTRQRDEAIRKREDMSRELTREVEAHRVTRAKLATVETKLEDVWLWQGDGRDSLPSLTAPVVMEASTLERLTAADSPTYNSGRTEGRADVHADLRKILDPEDREHLTGDALVERVRRFKDQGRVNVDLLDAINEERKKHAEELGVWRFDLVKHLERQREFSIRTFGPGDAKERAAGLVAHIRKELVEIEADPNDLEEWIDVVILAFDGAWRTGHVAENIAAALDAKQTKNEGRTWPDWRTAKAGEPIEHVRTGEGPTS